MANYHLTTPDINAPSMSANSRSHAGTVSAFKCPKCGEPGLIRIRRRLIDRFLSLFVKRRRFQCYAFQCRWQGNLKQWRVIKLR